MRRVLYVMIIMSLAGLASPSVAAAGELRITVRADWMLALRAGVEYRFGRYLGIQTSIGTNTQMLVADFGAVVFATPPESRWQVGLLLGVPNASMPFTFNAGFVSFGGSVVLSRRFENNMGLDLRIGEGFPLFFEQGKVMIRDIQFPFNLWPDLGLGLSFAR